MNEDTTVLDEAIELYETTRQRITKALKANPKEILGGYSWLAVAIDDSDIAYMIAGSDGRISFSGRTYTCQTMEHESFEGVVAIADLPAL